MRQQARAFIIMTASLFFCYLASADRTDALNRALPHKYGRVVIGEHDGQASRPPVVFDHWLHRALYTCRLCHVDIGFAMKADATGITAETNERGFYCGACHNGKRCYNGKIIFAACSEDAPLNDTRCDRCHSLGMKVQKEYEFETFTGKMPKSILGNGIDWEEAESRGIIKPVDFLEGVSMPRVALTGQKDFSIESKSVWMTDVVFSHKKHSVWCGCEVCHPEIFPIKKGATKYTMLQINEGEYCGACHDKVAFSLLDCQRCHTGALSKGP